MNYSVCQLQFLNYLLDTKDKDILVMNDITDKYFTKYTNEFEFIYNHIQKYGNIPDKATFGSTFKDFTFLKVEETPQFIVSELFKGYQSLLLRDKYESIRELLLGGDIEGAVQVAVEFAEKNALIGATLETTDLINNQDRYDEFADRTTNFNNYYVSTVFKELDAVLGGWDRKEDLVTIVARPNVGKSWILLKCAIASAMAGLKVGLYSGEMSASKVGYRADTLIGHLSNYGLTHGNDSMLNDYKDYIDNLPTMIKGSLKVLTNSAGNIDNTANVNTLHKFIQQEKLDILFIDQLTLLEDRKHGKNQFEQMANISVDLKKLQRAENIPIISVTQEKRSKDESKDTSLVGYSDRISQDSTCLIFLSRDPKNMDIMEMELVKVRDTNVGKKIHYLVDFDKGNFKYIPDEQATEISQEYENYEQHFEPEVGGEVVFN